MIELRDVSFRYANSEKLALNSVSLKIQDGEFLLILGDSGSGKSTLLRAMNGLIPHFYGGELKGIVEVDGLSTAEHGPGGISQRVGTVLQDPENQILMRRVDNELAFPLENMGMERDEISMRIDEIAEITGISSILDRDTSTLSGGEKQKVAIATALITHPTHLLLDEPTSQIDPSGAEEILSVLERINDELGTTIILVEHRLTRTMHRADRVVLMKAGKIIADGEPRIVATEHDMDAFGIGYPQITRTAKLLGMPFLPLTVKEGKKYLSNLKGKHNPRNVNGKIILWAKAVEFGYGKNRVLRGVSMEVRVREVVGIVGRNGSGKSTLAKILSGLVPPGRGRVTVYGNDIAKMNDAERAKVVSMVFQNPRVHLFHDTIHEDIGGGKKTERIMKELGIWEIRDRSAEEISGGERMMAAIATIAVMEPDILILDEPTRGLSWRFRNMLIEFIWNYAKKRSVIIISHDMELLAKTCTKIGMLSRGKIINLRSTHEFMSKAILYTTQLNKVTRKLLTETDVMYQ